MRRRGAGKRIFWPQYFDKNRTVKMGRRLPKNKAIPLPSVIDIAEAARRAGYESEIDPRARYPRSWWDPPGMVIISVGNQKKIKVMEKLAPIIEKVREERLKRERELKAAHKKKKKGPYKSAGPRKQYKGKKGKK